METFGRAITFVNDIIWHPAMLVFLGCAAVWFTIRLKGMQLSRTGDMLEYLFEKGDSKPDTGLSSFQAFATAARGVHPHPLWLYILHPGVVVMDGAAAALPAPESQSYSLRQPKTGPMPCYSAADSAPAATARRYCRPPGRRGRNLLLLLGAPV